MYFIMYLYPLEVYTLFHYVPLPPTPPHTNLCSEHFRNKVHNIRLRYIKLVQSVWSLFLPKLRVIFQAAVAAADARVWSRQIDQEF